MTTRFNETKALVQEVVQELDLVDTTASGFGLALNPEGWGRQEPEEEEEEEEESGGGDAQLSQPEGEVAEDDEVGQLIAKNRKRVADCKTLRERVAAQVGVAVGNVEEYLDTERRDHEAAESAREQLEKAAESLVGAPQDRIEQKGMGLSVRGVEVLLEMLTLGGYLPMLRNLDADFAEKLMNDELRIYQERDELDRVPSSQTRERLSSIKDFNDCRDLKRVIRKLEADIRKGSEMLLPKEDGTGTMRDTARGGEEVDRRGRNQDSRSGDVAGAVGRPSDRGRG